MSKAGVYLVSATNIDGDKNSNAKYTSSDDIDLNLSSDQKDGTPFRGMGKEELLRHSQKPFWIKLRMICVSIILIGWLALIITVVALIFAYPKCKDKDARLWWQNDVMYRIYVRSFYDSDGDGNGDLKGIQSKLDYIKDLGVGTISLSPIFETDATEMDFSIVNHTKVSARYGTEEDLRNLIKAVHDKGMHIILDFIPDHTSDKHVWFSQSRQSSDRTNAFRNYYVWSDVETNWNSVYGNSSWTMDTTRNQYYLHQFAVTQPDLNLRSSQVFEELEEIMKYWLSTENVDGFYIRSSGYLIEDYDMRNESRSNIPGISQDDYDYYTHEYTYRTPDNLLVLSRFRELADSYSQNTKKVLMADISGTATDKMTYYGHFPGSGVQLSLNPLSGDGLCNTTCIRNYVTPYLASFSTHKWPNWMAGNEDVSRFLTRFPSNFSKPYFMMTMLLPGTPIVYYGEEIGMVDLQRSWDPESPMQRMRGLMQWSNTTNNGFQNCSSTCIGPPWIDPNTDIDAPNAETLMKTPGSLYSFIKELASLRTNDAFIYGEYHTAVSSGNIFSFVREFDGVTGYLVAINFGVNAETHDYTSTHSTIQSPAKVVLTSGGDVGWNVDDDVETNELSLGPLQGIVVSWDYKAKEL